MEKALFCRVRVLVCEKLVEQAAYHEDVWSMGEGLTGGVQLWGLVFVGGGESGEQGFVFLEELLAAASWSAELATYYWKSFVLSKIYAVREKTAKV